MDGKRRRQLTGITQGHDPGESVTQEELESDMNALMIAGTGTSPTYHHHSSDYQHASRKQHLSTNQAHYKLASCLPIT